MDKLTLNSLIETVLNDKDNTNQYKGLNVLLESLSDDEVMYFIEGCGENIFENDNLSLIMWETHPLIYYDYIGLFIDEKIDRLDENLTMLNQKRSNGKIDDNEYKELTNGFLLQKNQLLSLKNGFVSNIVNFIKNNS